MKPIGAQVALDSPLSAEQLSNTLAARFPPRGIRLHQTGPNQWTWQGDVHRWWFGSFRTEFTVRVVPSDGASRLEMTCRYAPTSRGASFNAWLLRSSPRHMRRALLTRARWILNEAQGEHAET